MKKVYFFGAIIASMSMVACSTSEETVMEQPIVSEADSLGVVAKDSIKSMKRDVRGQELLTPKKQGLKPQQEVKKEVL